jgi:hypothetical protein
MRGGNSGQNADHYGNSTGKRLVRPAVWALIKGQQV